MTDTILVVEDDKDLQELYALMLEEVECQIVCAYDGTEALERLEETTPSLIILDILLDEMMGDQVFMQLKQKSQHASIPVVIASVLPSDTCQKLLEGDSRTIYLQKPFHKTRFLDIVREYLNTVGESA
jgi:two-component system response regulator VicR